ncbi:MAG TPA: amidohydrolase family protein [Candidatus Sulfotelmatobacter sp.]|nr:amidohydrolase family protein [Candidatus Sulfotelmatobacter sp.]
MLSRRDALRAIGAAGVALAAAPARAAPSQPKTVPSFAVPPGACDCHVHVIGDPARYPMAAGRVYTPPQASVDALLALQRALHLDRVVVVQPSIYGSDNRCMMDAVRQLGARARGIAVIDDDVTDNDLDDMQHVGIRGVRINLETAGDTGMSAARVKFWAAGARISGRDWHIQCYARLSVVAALKDDLGALPVPVVLDHFGGAHADGGQPGFSALLELVRTRSVYVKLSAVNRVSMLPGYGDVAPLARALIEAGPDRMLWGSDWPHTNSARTPGRGVEDISPFTPVDDGVALNLLADWAPDPTVRRQILVDNPARLYKF